jgi:O-antigen/teichoic acid export membrane protein
MGFVLSIVLARGLGAAGSGVVLQAIAAFTIALSVARLGMDTAAVWLVPRLRIEDPTSVRGACTALLVPAAATGVVVALAWWGVVSLFGSGVVGGSLVGDSISATAVTLPLGAVMMVALAATRGFGGVVPFNLIGNIAVPLVRPLAILLVLSAGGSVVAASVAWALPLLPAALASLWVLRRQVRAFESRRGVTGDIAPSPALRRRVFGYALPRTIGTALEQSVIWLDVLLVGIIAGPAAAGVYGAASRFVRSGVIVSTALRIVVAPRFSAQLAEDRKDEVQELFTVTSCWILLFGTPIYVLLACFAPTVLGWLGPGFGNGASSMVILCLGSLVVLAAGNVQSLLLMSGRSGWGAVNKAIVLAFNVVGNVLLIPHYGYGGAAVTWAATMALDTVLAVVQVHRFTGVGLSLGRISVTLLISSACAAVPSALTIALMGASNSSFLVAGALMLVLIAGYCALDRERLQINVLIAMGRRR